jgi:Methyltransferase domain
MHRVLTPETLDHLPPADPRAIRSRRDLARVHRVMGTPTIIRRAWQTLVLPPPGRSLSILELGAGDGSLLLGVARSLAAQWPPVQLSLLDQHDIVSRATREAYERLGWTVRVVTVDVLAWAAEREPAQAQAGKAHAVETPPDEAHANEAQQTEHWDLISTALFLHHFESEPLRRVLAAAAARCDHFFACEPARSWPALAGSHLVAALGANAVTREDAVTSVHAGFRADELSAHWPRMGPSWQLQEASAGLFSHCFSARRTGAGR